MNLSKKTFLYSLFIGLIVGLTVISYMVFLLPSMYIDYQEQKNYDKALTTFQNFIDGKDQKKSGFNNGAGIIIPKTGYTLKVKSGTYDLDITLPEGSTHRLLDYFRMAVKKNKLSKLIDNKETAEVKQQQKQILKELKLSLKELQKEFSSKTALYKIKVNSSGINYYEEKRSRFHMLNKQMVMGEFIVIDKNYGIEYTSFIGIGIKEDKIYLSFTNNITPHVEDVQPVILGAVPVILPLIALFAFLVSELFSRRIIRPVTKLAEDARKRRDNSGERIDPIVVKGKDEIANLASSLNLLYKKQEENYLNLKNENERKEVFMRASSHRLKTPIAAALLLVDGMIGNIGKFKDREKYLPEVKNQLKTMEGIVNEMMSINHLSQNIRMENVRVDELIKNIYQLQAVNALAKELKVNISGEADMLGDIDILFKIFDNLINNAIKHTPNKGEVKILINRDQIRIMNRPAEIPAQILPNIFEPFVSKNEEKGNGLGLYVVKYLCEISGLVIRVEIQGDQVMFIVERGRKND